MADTMVVMRRNVAPLILALVLVGVVAACAGSELDLTGQGRDGASSPPPELVRRPFTASELDVLLDPAGRPYDSGSAADGADSVETEAIGSLVVPDGKLRVMDGNAIEVDPAYFADQASEVQFDTEMLDAAVIWERYDGVDRASVLAVTVVVPETTVARWEPFEPAYGTDGGTGGVTTQSVIDTARTSTRTATGEGFVPSWDYEAGVSTFDLDEVPGSDTILFANGFGDGGFPMSRGLDSSGRLVALAVLDNRYPWRLAFPVGEPPADITTREDEIAACLAGERDVEVLDDQRWCTSES